MHQNRIWKFFLLALALVVLWFSGSTTYKMFNYLRLNSQAPAEQMEWSVVEASEDRFLLQASYIFHVDEKVYHGNSVLVPPFFRNEWAAKQDLPTFAARQWQVWYFSWDPGFSSLQKNFPIKECISTLLLWGILIYFVRIGYYVAKLSK